MPIPKLRFKDNQGRDYPDKIVKRIENLILEYKEKVDANSNLPILTSSKQFGIEFQEDHFAGKQRHDIEGYNVLPRNYCTYRNRSDGLDFKFNINTICEKGIISKFYPVFKGNNCNLYFLKTLLNNDPATLRKIAYTAKGTSQKILSITDLKKITVTIPTLPEQEKIADFLSAYDRQIDIQSQRVEAMKVRKKGLLQKIFSQEIRFKDDKGKEFPKWEEKKLGEAFDYMNYGMNAAAKPYDGENKYLRITDIDEDNNQYKQNSYVSPSGDLQEKYVLHEGDICFARTGASVGKTYIYNPLDGKVYFAGFLIRGHVSEMCVAYFIFLQTLSDKYNKWVKIMSARTGQPGINLEEYKTFAIDVPSLPEQQKIADFFTAVDKQIEVEEKRLETMKIIKKGLLQQMFI